MANNRTQGGENSQRVQNAGNKSKELGIDMENWWKQRNKFPYQSENGYPLDFNFWVTHSNLVDYHLVDIIESALFQGKPHSLGKVSTQPERVMIMTLNGVDSKDVIDAIPELAFLKNSTSVPILSVTTDQYQESTNNWFYNDVRSLSALLLWPKVPTVSFESVQQIPSIDIFKQHKVTFLCTHGEGKDQITFIQDPSYYEIIMVVKMTCNGSLERKLTIAGIVQTKLLELNEDCCFGRFIRHGSNDKGFFLTCPSGEEEHQSLDIKPLILMLIWETGNVDILTESSSYHEHVHTTFQFDTRDAAAVDPDDKFQLKIRSLLPNIHEQSLPDTENTPDESKANTTINASPKEKEVNSNHTVADVDNMILFSKLKLAYQSLSHDAIQKCVTSRDILEILGYMQDVDVTNFMDTSSAKWRLQSFVPYLPVVEEKVVTLATKNTQIRVDLEEGEEGEDMEASNSIEVTSTMKQIQTEVTLKATVIASHSYNRLRLQAAHCIDYGILTPYLPLKVCALDCEMCSTALGLELTRITIVHPILGIVLDTLVKPDNVITDYHTEFSGVSKDLLVNITVKFRDIQEYLRNIINHETILVGHSMDTDLRVLQLVHPRLIDTACLFPHQSGLPYKHSLKKLAKDILDKDIQDSTEGHDSIQDAVTALELLVHKLQEGIELDTSIFPEKHPEILPHCTLFERLMFKSKNFPTPLSCRIWSNPMYMNRYWWERHGLGYRKDSSIHFAHEEFLTQNANNANGIQIELSHHRNWQNALESIKKELSTNAVAQHNLLWVDMAVDFDNYNSPVTATVEESTEPPTKRMKLNEQSSSSTSSSPTIAEQMKILDNEIQSIYESLPSKTLFIVITQKSLATLRYLISKKLRHKWDSGNATKKKAKVAIAGKDNKPLRRLSIDWDNNIDEPKLLEEANNAAKCISFHRYKS